MCTRQSKMACDLCGKESETLQAREAYKVTHAIEWVCKQCYNIKYGIEWEDLPSLDTAKSKGSENEF